MSKSIVKYGIALVIFFLYVAIFSTLYVSRSLDDSRLTSWRDVFTAVRPSLVLVYICSGLVASFILSRIAFIERNPIIFLGPVAFISTAFFWKEPEMIVDASRYFTYAKYFELYGIGYFWSGWGSYFGIWTDLPAIPFIYGLIFSIFGENRTLIQAFNSIIFSSAVIFTYRTGRELWGRDAGLYAGLFMLSVPYLYVLTPLMLVDIHAMSFLAAAFYFFLRALRQGGFLLIICSALSITLALFTKYSVWPLLSVIPVLYVVEMYNNRKGYIDKYALRGMVILFFAVLLVSITIAFKHDEIVKQLQLLFSYQKPGLSRWGESIIPLFLFQVNPVIGLFAILSVFVALRRLDLSFLPCAWIATAAFVLNMTRLRYLVSIIPFISLMAAYGLSSLRDRETAKMTAFSAAAFSIAVAYAGFLPFLMQTSAVNIKNASNYLDSLNIHKVHVITPLPEAYVMNPASDVPLLDLFTKKEIFYKYSPVEYPPPADIATSSLRFTWDYHNPPYYEGGTGSPDAVLVITDSADSANVAEMRKKTFGLSKQAVFSVWDDFFEHQTIVSVYH